MSGRISRAIFVIIGSAQGTGPGGWCRRSSRFVTVTLHNRAAERQSGTATSRRSIYEHLLQAAKSMMGLSPIYGIEWRRDFRTV
jgi:hypothetical protein